MPNNRTAGHGVSSIGLWSKANRPNGQDCLGKSRPKQRPPRWIDTKLGTSATFCISSCSQEGVGLKVGVEMACNTMAHRIFCRGWGA